MFATLKIYSFPLSSAVYKELFESGKPALKSHCLLFPNFGISLRKGCNGLGG